MHRIGLLLWMVLCFAVAGMGRRWTAGEVKGWYRTLTRPAIAPPMFIYALSGLGRLCCPTECSAPAVVC